MVHLGLIRVELPFVCVCVCVCVCALSTGCLYVQCFLTVVLFTFCTCCILRCLVCIIVNCIVCIVVVVLCVSLSSYVYLLYYLCIAVFTLDAGLLAISQYSEGPATGHLDTGFSRFPCVYKQVLRWSQDSKLPLHASHVALPT